MSTAEGGGLKCTPANGSPVRSKSVKVLRAACVGLRIMVLRETTKKLMICIHDTTCRIKMQTHQTLAIRKHINVHQRGCLW